MVELKDFLIKKPGALKKLNENISPKQAEQIWKAIIEDEITLITFMDFLIKRAKEKGKERQLK